MATLSYFFRWLKWKWQGSPTVTYPGQNCGCCGAWIDEPATVPEFTADGWWDTWSLCEKCIKGGAING